MEKNVGQIVLCVAILCLTILEMWALYLGHNGLLLSLVIGAICATAGVNVEKKEILKNLEHFYNKKKLGWLDE